MDGSNAQRTFFCDYSVLENICQRSNEMHVYNLNDLTLTSDITCDILSI